MKPNYEILPRKILKFYRQTIVWSAFADLIVVRRKFKPLAHSAKRFRNFTSQNFKILTKPNSKFKRSQILKFYRSKILKFHAAEFTLSFHKRYILKFRRSLSVKFHAALKLLKTSAVARVD